MSAVDLRPVEEGDRDRLLAWRNSPDVAAHMYSDQPITPEGHNVWFSGISSDPRRTYWIITLDQQPVGLANIYDLQEQHRRCAWAYYLADPATRGKGVGAYVEYRVLQYVFEDLGLNKLWCEVLARNEAVWKLHLSFGFREEARFRDHIRKNGVFEDVLGLGLLADEWRAARPQCENRLRAKGYAV